MSKKLDQRIAEAHKRLAEIERQRDDETMAASTAIHAKYADDLLAAKRALAEAKKAKSDHIDATASHPWDGKRVYRETPKYASRWSSRIVGTERTEGVLEVVRQSSQFPANLHWTPSLGTVIIRKLKKDGSPSLQTHKVWGSVETQGWKLDE